MSHLSLYAHYRPILYASVLRKRSGLYGYSAANGVNRVESALWTACSMSCMHAPLYTTVDTFFLGVEAGLDARFEQQLRLTFVVARAATRARRRCQMQ